MPSLTARDETFSVFAHERIYYLQKWKETCVKHFITRLTVGFYDSDRIFKYAFIYGSRELVIFQRLTMLLEMFLFFDILSLNVVTILAERNATVA